MARCCGNQRPNHHAKRYLAALAKTHHRGDRYTRVVDDDTNSSREMLAAIGGSAKLVGLFVIAAGSLISIWLIGSLLLDWAGEIF